MPGGITVGRDGLYVTNNAGSPGGGRCCASGRAAPSSGPALSNDTGLLEPAWVS